MFCGQSAAGTHLGLIAGRKGHVKPGRDQGPLERLQNEGLFQIGFQIHAGALLRGIGRTGIGRMVYDGNFHYLGALTYRIMAMAVYR